MTRCIICDDEIEEKNGELCNTCLEFFVWKYNSGLKDELDRFREAKKFIERWREGEDSDEREVGK